MFHELIEGEPETVCRALVSEWHCGVPVKSRWSSAEFTCMNLNYLRHTPVGVVQIGLGTRCRALSSAIQIRGAHGITTTREDKIYHPAEGLSIRIRPRYVGQQCRADKCQTLYNTVKPRGTINYLLLIHCPGSLFVRNLTGNGYLLASGEH
jgi:hypothetical protein